MVRVLLIAVLLATYLPFLSAANLKSTNSNRPEIRFSASVWPALMDANGEGLFADLITRALPQYHVVFHIVPWRRATQMLQSGGVDGQVGTYKASLINQVDPGIALISNTVPIYIERVVLLCRENRQIRQWKAVFTAYQYAWPRGYDYEVHLKIPKKLEVHDTEQGIRMLLADRLDCYIDDSGDIEAALSAIMEVPVALQQTPLATQALFISFLASDRNLSLANELDQGLRKLYESGEARQLFIKWGVEYSRLLPPPLR